MKKRISIIVGIIIGFILSSFITVVYSLHIYNSNEISYNPANSNFKVNNVESALDSLNNDFTSYKSNMLSILNGKGLNVTESTPISEIEDGLSDLKPNAVVYLGRGTSFDLKTKVPDIDYTSLTSDNFIAVVKSLSSLSGQDSTRDHNYLSGRIVPFNLTVSYNNSTGVVTVGGVYYGFYVCLDDSYLYCTDDARGYANASPDVYLVTGKIE